MHDLPATFKRHDLLFLDPAGHPFQSLADCDSAGVAEWLAAGRPVVVRRPGVVFGGGAVHCGIPLPPGPGRARIGFVVPVRWIKHKAELPTLRECLGHLPPAQQSALAPLLESGLENQAAPRVFGSLAWQHLTGLPYRQATSDIDLRFRVTGAAALDRLVAILRTFPQLCAGLCDIEIELWNGWAFSWREFMQDSRRLLIKTVNDVFLLEKSGLAIGPAADPGLWPERIATELEAALGEELETYPKPGLVSYVDNGSHRDMTAGHFKASIRALRKFFKDSARAGMRGAELAELRSLGVAAEKQMLAATGGVNTHRGAIFTLGLLAAAAGYKVSSGAPEGIGQIVQARWGRGIMQAADNESSHGREAARRYACGGARAEAAGGFQTVYARGLPAFKSVQETSDRNAARVHCFFAMLDSVQDTTLLHRGGLDGLMFARNAAQAFNAGGGVKAAGWQDHAVRIHREFIRRHLSCGGVADLLAATIFIHRLEELCPA